MFTPRQMSRLLIVASRDQMAPVIKELYRQHIFHIEDFVEQENPDYEGFKIGSPLSGATEASVDLVKVRAIENAFIIDGESVDAKARHDKADLQARIERELPVIEREVEDLTNRRSRLEATIKESEQKVAEILPFTTLPADLDLYRGYRGFVVFAGYVSHDVVLSVPCEKHYAQEKGKGFIIIVTSLEHRGEVERTLQNAAFQSVSVPAESGSPQALVGNYSVQISQCRTEIEEIAKTLDRIKQEHTEFLVACEELLKAGVEQAEAPLRFATTSETFVCEGWVPADKTAKVLDGLLSAARGKIFVTELPVDPVHDKVPVEYNNPSFARPAQILVDTYSRPKYSEIDPTILVSIIFPVFFGIILGDMGYGLILLVMCLGLLRFMKAEDGQLLLKTLRNASISSIFFGVLYSEFLGFACPWKPILFARHLNIGAHATGHGPMIPELMIMAAWVGIFHITLGRVVGIFNHARQDHGSHRVRAVMANAGWICVLWGILVLIWAMAPMPIMPDFTGLPVVVLGLNAAVLAGGVILVLGIVFIARESALEIVELPTVISNVLSYSRLVAVGLSSVAIAMVINYIAVGMLIEPNLEQISIIGVVFIIIGLLVFLGGHLANTLLGIIGGGLHSIRLHYVEFFTKFYKGGGVKFSPFGLKRRFSED